MNCPKCDTPMRDGELSLDYTLPGFLAAGISHLELFFTAPNEKRARLMGPMNSLAAEHCKSCGTIVFRSPHSTGSDCLECGNFMVAHTTKCEKCGWTFESGNQPADS